MASASMHGGPLAILSDIHSNLDALEVAHAELEKRGEIDKL